MSDLVWYAAYGSNLSRARFGCYIKGGRPEGAKRDYPGCRDISEPKSDRPWKLTGALVFGKESGSWTGHGVAFLDLTADETAYSRLYLVTHEQFEDIAAQENFPLEPGDVQIPRLDPGEETDLGRGFYPIVLCAGELEGHRVLTLTDRLIENRKPSPAYLRHIARGLRDAHHLSAYQAADYLSGRPGISGLMSSEELLDVVRSS